MRNNCKRDIFDLSGKKALITGSSRGIGKSLALGLAAYGADVMIHCAHNIERAREVADEARKYNVESDYVAADFSKESEVEKLSDYVSEIWGDIDILILNASYQIKNSWQQVDPEEFDLQTNINFKSSFQLIQSFAPAMLDNKWGRIITIGSVQQAVPHPEMVVYAACKMAQLSMAKNLAVQFSSSGVTVNNVAPGVIDTDRNSEALSDEAYKNKVLAKIPSGQIGKPDDCLGVTLLLCSEAGRYITGEDIYVDGGMKL